MHAAETLCSTVAGAISLPFSCKGLEHELMVKGDRCQHDAVQPQSSQPRAICTILHLLELEITSGAHHLK